MKLRRFLFPALLMHALPAMISAQIDNPILFVTQVAPSEAHQTVTSIDGSLQASTAAAPRGGDLMIVYPNRAVKNLTRTAGFGIAGSVQKGDAAIAVRDPHVHFSGTKALFSMVRGAPSDAADTRTFHWQIYEITGLGMNETPVITLVPHQHPDYNNVQPAYLSDGRIVYATDCPVTTERHLYPALDEKGMAPAGTGLWTLDPQATAESSPAMLTHAPSGAFEPFVDSFGRVMFTRWDLLQRDEHAADNAHFPVDYQNESPAATYGNWQEIFPEPLPGADTNFGLSFDLFLPWTINQDGNDLNTLNHLGRHELTPAFPRSGPEPELINFETNVPTLPPDGTLPALTRATAFLHLSEHPAQPGRYLGVDVLATSVSAGRAVSVFAPPTMNPDQVTVRLISQEGLARDTSWMQNGRLLGSWVPGPPLSHSHYGDVVNQPVPPDFIPSACFTIRAADGFTRLERGSTLVVPAVRETTQIVSGEDVTRTANLWQLQPVEVIARTIPPALTVPLETPEASIFIRAGVSPSGFRTWLHDENKALLSCRNVTTRDQADRQQLVNLAVQEGATSTAPGEPVHTVERVQFFQGEYLRAYAATEGSAPKAGRRITARTMRAEAFTGNPPSAAPAGSTPVAHDGSMAAIVPAGRAVSWELANDDGDAVVRERYWLSFNAGELRACTSCHGVNTRDQLGRPPSTNPPEALNTLLTYWKSAHPSAPAQATSYKVWSEVNLQTPSETTMHVDNDGDGMTNLEEFVYGTNPRTAEEQGSVAQKLTAAPAPGGATTLSFTRNLDATGTEIIAESSANLSAWQEEARLSTNDTDARVGVTVTEATTPEQSSRRLSACQVSIPASHDTRRSFFRLRFIVP
jgi:hypothetical protein